MRVLFLFILTLIFSFQAYSQSGISIRKGERPTGSAQINPDLKPFYHGVASGDPTPNSVIIWTRVTPENSGPISGTWAVATDTSFNNIVKSGTFNTDEDKDYTVKVDVSGLNSNSTYFYDFEVDGAYSLIGRTKTAPVGTEEMHLRFAVVSCSNYEAGYFNAYARIADRNDLAAVIHLGDYFYEYPAGNYGDSALSASGKRAHDSNETFDLEKYRSRYSLYKMDSNLMRLHQQHPMISVWDDHESANDAHKDGAENHTEGAEGSWEKRKRDSRTAYYEWMPIRETKDSTIYRSFRYGNLVDLVMLDTRITGRDSQINDVTNPAMYSPTRTMLGTTQRSWLLNELATSKAKWKIVGNQVIFSEFHVGWAASTLGQQPAELESQFVDIWDGYPVERAIIMNTIEQRGIDNTVFLTGDFHCAFAFDVADTVTNVSQLYAPTSQYDPSDGTGSIAVEFATPSVTSANFDENLNMLLAQQFQYQINNDLPSPVPPGHKPNPHMKYVDLIRHGYFILDIKEDSTAANYYYVNDILNPNGNEIFDTVLYTMQGANHLTAATAESEPKVIQDIPAPITKRGKSVGIEQLKGLTILGVYPNPVGEVITIHYALKKSSKVNMSIYDVNGRLVQSLMEKTQEAGVYDAGFQLNNLESGTYNLLIDINGETTSRSLVKP